MTEVDHVTRDRGGDFRRTSPVPRARRNTSTAMDIIRRNHQHGQSEAIQRRLAPKAIPDCDADEYLFAVNGSSQKADTIAHIIAATMTHDYTLDRPIDELIELVDNGRLYCRSPKPLDVVNSSTIIIANKAELPQDAVEKWRCEKMDAIVINGPFTRNPKPVDEGDVLLQALIGADLAIPRPSLPGRVVQVCGYYEGDPRIDRGQGLIEGLSEMHLAAVPSRDEPVFSSSKELRALGLLLESHHAQYGRNRKYVIGIRDARLGHLEAYLVNQATNRPMRLSDGTIVSIHVPGDIRSEFLREVRKLSDSDHYYANPVGSEGSFDYGALRTLYEQTVCDDCFVG